MIIENLEDLPEDFRDDWIQDSTKDLVESLSKGKVIVIITDRTGTQTLHKANQIPIVLNPCEN